MANSLTFHVLDVSAQDEFIESENVNDKVVAYNPKTDSEAESDDEIKPPPKRPYKAGGGAGGGYKKDEKRVSCNPKARLVIHLFGATATGQKVRCDVRDFEPFFYIRSPEGPFQDRARSAVRRYIERQLGEENAALVKVTPCKRKVLFGFNQDREINMLELRTVSKSHFNALKNLFLNSSNEPNLRGNDELGAPFRSGAPEVYEANLDPMLRFLHLRNLKPCGWVTLNGFSADEEEDGDVIMAPQESLEVDCSWDDVEACHNPPRATAPFTIASWDLECYSPTGDFPVAKRGDPIIQIGTILTRLGSHETENHIFTLNTCEEIPGVFVHAFKTEKAMLKAWFQWVAKEDIDVLIGQNVFGFDERQVWDRCEALGLSQQTEVQSLNRLSDRNGVVKLEEKRLSSSAMGDNFLQLLTTTGRLRIDLYHYIKRGQPLPSQKLDDTSRNFLGEKVKSVSVGEEVWNLAIGPSKQGPAIGRSVVLLNDNGDTLCEKCVVKAVADGCLTIETPPDVETDEVAKWAIVKDDVTPAEMFRLFGGSAADRAIIAKQCVQDCQLVLDLFRKLDVFNNAMSMANVCSVPVGYIFLRGQGVKIESLMFKQCHEAGQAITVLTSQSFQRSGDEGIKKTLEEGGEAPAGEDSQEGAIVLDPTPGFQTVPVGVADFASLQPSTIISENISHDTLVWAKDQDLDGKFVSLQWGSDDQDNLPGVRQTDISYDILKPDPADTRKHPEKIKAGVRICRQAQEKIGTIPLIVQGLLATRKSKRKEAEKEEDPFKKALLDAEQLAQKLTANSLQGQLGSGTFKVRLQALAASVTAQGRKQILFSKAMIENFYGPKSGHPEAAAEIVQGDTDSLFIAFHPKDPKTGRPLEGRAALEKTISLTEEAGKFVTKALKSPHDFEFDKVQWPFIIFSKKRYVGHKYESGPDDQTLAFMGVALKRRDQAAIVKKIQSSALNILLHERDVPKAAQLVRQMAVDLVEGKQGLAPLTISKSLRAEQKTASPPAHKVLADRIARRTPGDAPASGDRIPFIQVQPPVGQQAAQLQGDRIETPSQIKENGLKPDQMFQIDHQIANPVCQLFGVVLEQIPGQSASQAPKGGWNADPKLLATQRETAAYNLLFDAAISKNKATATNQFMKLLGVTTSGGSKNTVMSVAVPAKRAAVLPPGTPRPKQCLLDSFFLDTMKMQSAKAQVKKEKEAAKKTAAAEKEAGEAAGAVAEGTPVPAMKTRSSNKKK